MASDDPRKQEQSAEPPAESRSYRSAEPEPEDTGPAEPRDIGGRRATATGYGLRSVKMLYPRCEVCQDPANIRPRWWETCSHDPYYSVTEETITEPIIEINDQGEREIVDRKQRIVQHRHPNLKQVAVHLRLNSGGEVPRRRAQGYIFPEEHPTEPLKPFCQYHDCWSQSIEVRSPAYGDYCSKEQAQMVGLDYQEKPVHVDQGKRTQQLREVVL